MQPRIATSVASESHEEFEKSGLKLSPVAQWLSELNLRSLAPVIRIIDKNAKWDISEAVWIDRLTREGAQLLNVASRVP